MKQNRIVEKKKSNYKDCKILLNEIYKLILIVGAVPCNNNSSFNGNGCCAVFTTNAGTISTWGVPPFTSKLHDTILIKKKIGK